MNHFTLIMETGAYIGIDFEGTFEELVDGIAEDDWCFLYLQSGNNRVAVDASKILAIREGL